MSEMLKFGETRIINPSASEDNPHREGIYVETIMRPRNGINPGQYIRVTDGNGEFWLVWGGSYVAVTPH